MKAPVLSAVHHALLRHLRTWHRRLGVSAAAFIIFLSLSGIALNHANDTGLDRAAVRQAWLQDLYGIKAPASSRVQRLRNHLIEEIGGSLWVDGRLARDINGALAGAVLQTSSFTVLQGGRLLLFDNSGQTLDDIGSETGLPHQLTRIGQLRDRLVVASAGKAYLADTDALLWQPLNDTGLVIWAASEQTTAEQHASLAARYRGRLLNWERVLLDVHSGRILGRSGPWLADLVAVLLILLSCSGIYVWIRRWRLARRRPVQTGP